MPSPKKKPARKPRKATVRTPVAKLSGKESLEHYNGILIEDILSKVKTMQEGVLGELTAFRQDFQRSCQENAAHFRILESAIRCNSEAIGELKTDVAELKTDVAELKTNVAELKTDVAGLKHEVAGIKTDMSTMESRLTARIDRIGVRQDDHEGRISALEAAHA